MRALAAHHLRALLWLSFLFLLIGAAPARAQLAPQERLCDPVHQDCRADLLTYIRQETVGIDAGFWLMDDDRYAQALIAKWQSGVPVRVLMDPRCVEAHAACKVQLDELSAAGVPMRYRTTPGILHWKTMLFASQQQLEFAGANYSPFELVPDTPWINYTEEVVYYTNDPAIVHSFMTEFDTLWTSTSEFANYANVTGPLVRRYPSYPISPDLNFPPDQSYRDRSTAAYARETQGIDAQMFRITDAAQSTAIITAVNRGVPVRLITDEGEYRNPARLWDAYNVDLMYQAGVQVRLDAHQGIDHEKAVVCRAQGLSIFGSSNWTSPSTDSQREHNYFTAKPWIFQWLTAQFERKWNNSTGNSETTPFVPRPPDAPEYVSPPSGAVPTSGTTLSWYAGPWGQLYDVYLGVSPNPPLLAANRQLGPSESSTDYKTFALPPLQPGTTYYWRIVSKTMAYAAAAGPVSQFTTAGVSTLRVPADFDHDGLSDIVIWRPSSGTWYRLQSSSGYTLGATGVQWGSGSTHDVPLTGDMDGDGIADFVVWRPGTSTFSWLTSSSRYNPASSGVRQWGNSSLGDVPMLADIDGDGKADLVVWRPSTGMWSWLLSSKGYSTASAGKKQWGNAGLGDQPLVGDIDGDGKADLVVWRASTGTWYWLTSSSGYASGSLKQWGNGSLADRPLLGDMDGDGKADLVVWRATTGTWFWLTSSSGYEPSAAGVRQWGNSSLGDIPLLADMDGDRRMDPVVWRGPTGVWYWLTSSSGYALINARAAQWGSSALGDTPIVK